MSDLSLKQKDKAAIAEFHTSVSRLLGNELVRFALFGSKLTGEDTPDSDIDLFILVTDAGLHLKDRILNLAFEVNLKHDVYISPRIISLSTFNAPMWRETPFLRGLRESGLTL